MYPILFKIGPFTVYSYGAMLAMAVLVCAYGLSTDAAKKGISRDAIFDLMFWAVVGGIIGARIFYVVLYWDYFAGNLLETVMINRGGLAWQGGFVGGVLAGVWCCRRHGLPLRQMLDLTAPYIALGQAVGRIGCFFNGCCFGRAWEHGIYFPVHHARLHPTQLYETVGLFVIFILLKMYAAKSQTRGMVFVAYLWLAAIERFIVEFFRADHDQLWWGLSLSQFITVAVFIAGIITYFLFKKERRHVP